MSKRRYFEDSKFKPGVISCELRSALSLSSSSLPEWVYRMRVLGYPPGYLLDAQTNTLLFDGKQYINNKSNTEDGEILTVHYNKESFIEYPGFNVALPQGVKDEWYELRMPPMLPQQQLKEALKTMKLTQPVPYKRLKRDLLNNSNNSSFNSDHSIITSPDSTNCSASESHICNNSLNESKTTHEISESPSSTSKNESIDSESSEFVRKLKFVSIGSPMPTSSNPKRPPLDNWAHGMSDLIYFENLPTSTGVYENKMKNVIKKIRHKNSL